MLANAIKIVFWYSFFSYFGVTDGWGISAVSISISSSNCDKSDWTTFDTFLGHSTMIRGKIIFLQEKFFWLSLRVIILDEAKKNFFLKNYCNQKCLQM